MSELVVDVGAVTSPTPAETDSTVADIVQATLGHLHKATRVEWDKLASGVSANAGTLTTTYQRPAAKAGAKLCIDLEEFHVWADSGATLTVEPGQFGSTSASHDTGAIIEINPEFSTFDVFREINNELRGLSAPGGLWREATVTLAFNPARLGYDLTDVVNVDGIVSVVAETTGPERNRVPVPWRLERNVDTDVFPSGMALFVYEGWSGRDVFVTYKTTFGLVDSLTDSVEATTGLPVSAHDILAMGAALRLAGMAEIDRNQLGSQGSSRRANEVPAGSRQNAVRFPFQQYQRRVRDEADRLRRKYPPRLSRRF